MGVLLPILGFGNQWYFEEVILEHNGSNLSNTLLRLPAPFLWRFTPRSNATALWIGQVLAVLIVVVGLLFTVRAIARRAPGVGVFFGTFGALVLWSILASMVSGLLAYGDLFPNSNDPFDYGRFWYGVLQGPTALSGLWLLGVGAFASLLATMAAGPLPAALPIGPIGPIQQPAVPTAPGPLPIPDLPPVVPQPTVGVRVAPPPPPPPAGPFPGPG